MNELSRVVDTDDLPAGGRAVAVLASSAERSAIARRLELLTLATLQAELTVEERPGSAGLLLAVTGTGHAVLDQACSVTLEPVPADLTFPIERLFGRHAEPEIDELDVDPLALDVEPLGDAPLDLGEVLVEELALALEPYPRHPTADAVLATLQDQEPLAGPFAILKGRA